MIKSKKQMFLVIGIFALMLFAGGVTYAFFNYTRTGAGNTIRVGRIAFISRQTETISLSNLFPIDPTETGIMDDEEKVGTLEIEIEGDTDYVDGVEYLISVVNSNITSNGKKLPISLDVTVTNLGTSNDDYFTAREDKNATIYKKLIADTLTGDGQLLEGYIKPNTTSGTIEGVNGKITIKAYLDKNKVLISDTYDGTESDNMGTPNSMATGKIVFTTSEWNALQSSGASFQIKVEANEGIWVENPNKPTPSSCFTGSVKNGNEFIIEGYDENCGVNVVIPSVLTMTEGSYMHNSNMTNEEINTCVDYLRETGFPGTDEEATSFCNGEETLYGSLQGGLDNSWFSQEQLDYFEEHNIIFIDNPQFLTYTVTEIGYAAFTKVIPGDEWIEYHGNLENVVIPYGITKIGESAFAGNKLTSIEIPNSVTTIETGAFSNNQLTSVEIPNSITEIGDSAFDRNQLTSVVIPNSVTEIGDSAFDRNQLTSVEIPDSVITIENHAFSSNQLTSVEIPNSVTTIGRGVFSENQLTSVEIPNSVTTIEDFAFYENQLTSVEIPNSVTEIGDSAFSRNQLTSVEIPNSVTTIEKYAFESNQLTSVEIPDSVTAIGRNAFNDNQLTSVEIPDSVTTIEYYAFANNQLTSVEIPDSVTTIQYYAFANNQLTSVEIPDSVTTIGRNAFNDNPGIVLTFNNRTCSSVNGMTYHYWGASSGNVYASDGVCN